MEGEERGRDELRMTEEERDGSRGRKRGNVRERKCERTGERQRMSAALGGGERGGSILMSCRLLIALFSFIWSIWLEEFNKRRANDLTRYPVISTDETPSLLDSLYSYSSLIGVWEIAAQSAVQTSSLEI